jgi:hypothetical protein
MDRMSGFTFGVNAVSERLALAGHRSCNCQWPVALTSGDQREMFSYRSTRASLLVNQFCCSVSRHSKRAKQQLALEDAVDLDLPILSNKTRSVRWHDLDSLTVVNEPGRLGHSAIHVDVEIQRLPDIMAC